MTQRFYLFDPNWWSFQWRYWRGQTPWDTNITPPEVQKYLDRAAPGRALDLGCGTGTNAVAMAKYGWQVVGIDFAPKAIRGARRKALQENLAIDFRVADVTDLSTVGGHFDYVLDIGCLHTLDEAQRQHYAHGLKPLVKCGGAYMLYAWLPRIWKGKRRGIAVDEIRALFEPSFQNDQTIIGEEGGGPSAWYWFTKR